MDRYATFANSSVGRRVVRRAGLPQPARLQRLTNDRPEVEGPVLVGGAGADQLFGSDGFDTTSYSTSTAGVRVSLLDATAAGGEARRATCSSAWRD